MAEEAEEDRLYVAGLRRKSNERNALLSYVRAVQEVGDSRRVDKKKCRQNFDIG